MAVTSIWRIKGYINKVILYIENKDKTRSEEVIDNEKKSVQAHDILDTVIDYVGRDSATEEKVYVSGVNCTRQDALQKMMNTKLEFGKLGGTTAYHGYQSFAEGEINPDDAHGIGIALAEELWGNTHEVLVATHLDKDNHIHNHFVVNTVSFVDGKKYYRSEKDYQRMREVSDRLCLEHGLSVIHNPQSRGMNYGEWRALKEGKPTVRGGIREDIDIVIQGSETITEFFDGLKQMGYEIDTSGKYDKIKPPDYDRFFRFQSLGPGYTPEDIQRRIANNYEPIAPKYPEQDPMENVLYKYTDIPGSFTIMGFRPLYQTYVYGLKVTKERPSSNKRMHWLLRTEIAKLDRYIFQSELLCRHNIDTAEQLADFKGSLTEQMLVIEDKRRELKNELKRAERTGNEDSINAVKENIKSCTDQLKTLREQVKACDEIFERSGVPREKLTELENILRKEKSADERISRSSRPDRQDVTERR
ncbi:relaxase/mobilization nuclease domain-containing protein [bacterium]|nr:relaxase/mobilization nuclease domain-containing protein [bacterium]